LDCHPLIFDSVPSEASYSHLVDKLETSNVLEKLRSKSSSKLWKKVLSQMTRSLLMPFILKHATRLRLNRKKKKRYLRNAEENLKTNGNNGFENKLKKRRISRSTTRKSKRNERVL